MSSGRQIIGHADVYLLDARRTEEDEANALGGGGLAGLRECSGLAAAGPGEAQLGFSLSLSQ